MSGVRNYAIVTASYWGFTLTDGALRMLVLLHFYSLGYTPLMLTSKSFRELFAKTRAINLMAAARIFLFGSRGVWFVVGLPVFLYSHGWHYMEVAGFIASWTIGYGLIQAIAPSVIRRSADGLSREVPEARLWGAVLTAIPVVLALVLSQTHTERPDLVITVGLGVFGFAFA